MNNTFWKNIRRYIRFAVILILAAVSVDAAAFSSGYFAGDSRLSKGRWVKIKVKDTGMHQITDIELKEMGFADPSKVAVFGFPAVSLSDYKLTERTPDDLPPVPAIRQGEKLYSELQGDGRFMVKLMCVMISTRMDHPPQALTFLCVLPEIFMLISVHIS